MYILSSSKFKGFLPFRWSYSRNIIREVNSAVSKLDTIYMKLALRQAQAGYREKEIPVGVVVVGSDGRVLAANRNKVNALQDEEMQAEIQCLRRARRALGSNCLKNCTLYTTLEPCARCVNYILDARISRVVYGVSDSVCGRATLLSSHAGNLEGGSTDVVGGILEKDCEHLIRSYYMSIGVGESVGSYSRGLNLVVCSNNSRIMN